MVAAAALNHPPGPVAASNSYVGTRSGQIYKLGQEIGAGGNGVVYAVARRPELVAKIQKYPLSAHDVEKLNLMMQGATPELLGVAAWPIDGLRDERGIVVGFVMSRVIEARPLYELYSPRARVQHFPSADFRFIVHAAANVARLFSAVHAAGFICGDVNHSNVMARQNGTVAAVDCDSMQVGDGSCFPCLVGTELFVPPELMGVALGATRRTTNHDNFGLAVLIFHLLFMGRHPFAGVYHGRGDMPIERAIAESRYAYSRDRARTQLSPPPLTVPMDAIGPRLADLFEQAFHPDARRGTRPDPQAWVEALDALKASLVACRRVPWHYHTAAKSCPWCALEGASKLKFFGGLMKAVNTAVADLETLWARYLQLVQPVPPPPPPTWQGPTLSFPPVKLRWPQLRFQRPRLGIKLNLSGVAATLGMVRWSLLFWLTASVCWAGWRNPDLVVFAREFATDTITRWQSLPVLLQALSIIWLILAWPFLQVTVGRVLARLFLELPPRRPAPVPLKKILQQANARFTVQPTTPEPSFVSRWLTWRRSMAVWRRLPAPPDTSDLRPVIEDLKAKLDSLALERDQRIKACANPTPEDEQKARYLGQFRIESAKLHNIGPARCAVLRSFGIDTAADIEEAKIAVIPGFGKNLTDKLLLWREHKEKSFVYNPSVVVDPLDLQRIDRDLAARRTKLMKELRARINELELRMAAFMASQSQSAGIYQS